MSTHHQSVPSPLKVSLPPLSSILNSPRESSFKYSMINTPVSSTNAHSFNTSNTSILNYSLSYNNPRKSFPLPSIDHLTSPTLRRSMPIPLPSLSSNQNKSFLPVTPLKLKHQQSVPLFFNQSTPLVTKSNPLLDNDTSFTCSTPFKLKEKSKSESCIISPSMNTPKNLTLKLTNSTTNLKKRKASAEDKGFAFISHSQETFLSNEPDIDNARLARRKRRRTSPNELAILKNEFKLCSTPNKEKRIEIANRVDMTEKAVQIWFQNRRQALRKNKILQFEEVLNKDTKGNIDVKDSNEVKDNNKVKESEKSKEDTELVEVKQHEGFKELKETEVKNNLFRDDNKENVNSLPPSGVFQSTPTKKKPLNDITNHQECHTFKFRSTDCGLIQHNPSSSRRQKPTMRLKLKTNGNTPTSSSEKIYNSNLFQTIVVNQKE